MGNEAGRFTVARSLFSISPASTAIPATCSVVDGDAALVDRDEGLVGRARRLLGGYEALVSGYDRLVCRHEGLVCRDEGLVGGDERLVEGDFARLYLDDALVGGDDAWSAPTRTEREGDEKRVSDSSATVPGEAPEGSGEVFSVSLDGAEVSGATDVVSVYEGLVGGYEDGVAASKPSPRRSSGSLPCPRRFPARRPRAGRGGPPARCDACSRSSRRSSNPSLAREQSGVSASRAARSLRCGQRPFIRSTT